MFAIVDCNNFYASCERAFRPELNGKPVAVLSNNDGCVIARSNEVKALGIEMGAPYHLNKQLFEKHNVHIFSSNYTLYGDMSRRVMLSLSQFTPEIEIYSIDEAFLHFSHIPSSSAILSPSSQGVGGGNPTENPTPPLAHTSNKKCSNGLAFLSP